MKLILMPGFSGLLGTGRRSKDDVRQINRRKRIVTKCRGIFVKMIRDAGSKFDDYSISPNIRQVLLH